MNSDFVKAPAIVNRIRTVALSQETISAADFPNYGDRYIRMHLADLISSGELEMVQTAVHGRNGRPAVYRRTAAMKIDPSLSYTGRRAMWKRTALEPSSNSEANPKRFLALRSLEEVGAILGITRERVRQIEREALHKIRFRLRKLGVTREELEAARNVYV